MKSSVADGSESDNILIFSMFLLRTKSYYYNNNNCFPIYMLGLYTKINAKSAKTRQKSSRIF